MRSIAIGFILLSAFLICRGYTAYCKRRLDECEGFLALLAFMRGQVSCYLRPLSEWKSEFANAALERVGFLPHLRESESLAEAYTAVEGELALSPEEKQSLSGFMRGFGHGYMADELALIDRYRDELQYYASNEKREIPRVGRLVRTLCTSVSLSLVILLL